MWLPQVLMDKHFTYTSLYQPVFDFTQQYRKEHPTVSACTYARVRARVCVCVCVRACGCVCALACDAHVYKRERQSVSHHVRWPRGATRL
jgi:hypothetical protein